MLKCAFALTVLLAVAHGWMDGSEWLYEAAQPRADDNSTMEIVRLTEAAERTGAVCLDGSPAAYYHRKGTGTGANKWYIHHQGGGWCESLEDCLGRSKTALGSSARYANTSHQNVGYFSTSPEVNPMMYNWNSVFMPYCDGGSFSGNNESVTLFQNEKLYFRGKRIREAIAAALLASGLSKATDVVISGCSAGGLSTFLHTDQWCDAIHAVSAETKCVGLPDSGFFLVKGLHMSPLLSQ
jgi:hypothetical protein